MSPAGDVMLIMMGRLGIRREEVLHAKRLRNELDILFLLGRPRCLLDVPKILRPMLVDQEF